MRRILLIISLVGSQCAVSGQGGEAPNYANSSQMPAAFAQAGKMLTNPVNLFSGLPSVSIPLYSYKGNSGLNLSVSVDYAGGGIQVGESASVVGLGWYLNTGGSINRTVRGMPDDLKDYGYWYAAAIPADWRSDASKYYHDSLDSQQDIFQYSFPGHSGSFYIGKNGQVVTVPLSKIRIIPEFQTASSFNYTLKAFRIIAEDGVKYDFSNMILNKVKIDATSFPQYYAPTPSGYYDRYHGVSWQLSQIISPFSSDTIKFTYEANGYGYTYQPPQITFVRSNGSRKTPWIAPGTGTTGYYKIKQIDFPDKTKLQFVYDGYAQYNGSDHVLRHIKIADTAFRFGYLFKYTDSAATSGGHHGSGTLRPVRMLLKSIIPWTPTEHQIGYNFDYYGHLLPRVGGISDTIQNQKDHWGLWNAKPNGDSSIPKINSYTWGADRSPNESAAKGSSLLSVQFPSGGYLQYDYELNKYYPYNKQANTVSIAAQTNSQNTVSLNQVFNAKHRLVFVLDKSVARTGNPPITSGGTLNVVIKSTDGTVTYAAYSLSLYHMWYWGMQNWTFNLPNGSYRLETSLASGTAITGSWPMDINWENKNYDNSVYEKTSGALRVKRVYRSHDGDGIQGSYDDYRYINTDGTSSGFLGEVPRYDYPFREIISGGSTTDYTAICSEPLAVAGFAQIGYSRVEVVRNSYSGNLGKEVYEFTNLTDVNSNTFNYGFPYVPLDIRNWGLGQVKRLTLYDSSGSIVKKTVNTYQVDTVNYTTNDFRSLKPGHYQTTFSSDPNFPPVTRVKAFLGQEYYLTGGRIYMTASHDTIYHNNGSLSASYQTLQYDTNFNVTKVTTSYDRNRGLEKETRMYYPYNYTIGGGIGKLRDSAIISQTVATESWITGDANPRITQALMTSYRQIANNEVKPDTIYAFISNKPIIQSTIGTFDPTKLNRNTTYFKPQSFFTSYSAKGNLIESKNLVTGISNALLQDYDQQYQVAAVTNSTHSDFAYTSFESAGAGNWTIASTTRDATQAFSGKTSYNLSNGSVSKSSLNSSKQYVLTLWAKTTSSVSVNSTSQTTPIATHNGWNLFSVSLSSVTSVTISGTGVIDEVRLHLKDANVTTSTYEPLIGVTSTISSNNEIAYNEYDKLNRLKLVRDRDRNIVKRLDYSDTTMLVSRTPVWLGIERRCNPAGYGWIDSLYRDINIWSDSSGIEKWVDQGVRDCTCPEISSNPQYKVVNGVCEEGVSGITASEYKKVLVDGFLQWRWVCTYRWCFSDGSQSTYYWEGIQTTACGITCYVEL